MDFNPTAEQRQLGDMVQRLLAQEYSFEARKAIVRSEAGWSRELWARLGELGLLALQIPEEHGGMAPAAVETLLTMTALGKALVVEPYLSSAVIATALIRELGPAAHREALLPKLASGELVAVLAHGERDAHQQLACVATTARRCPGGWQIRGHKSVVLHAPAAGVLLVSARTSGALADEAGVSLFLVPREAAGVELEAFRTIDGMVAADLALDVTASEDSLLGPEGGAFAALALAHDLGVAALCAEAVGALQATLDATVEYTRTRKQFGQPIARFQALQHRMADMLIHLEQARSMSFLAAMRCDDPDARQRRRAVSAAKVIVNQACRFVGQQAVQLHGGMGVTDELAVSHYFKRLLAIELSLGDTEHHLAEFIAANAAETR